MGQIDFPSEFFSGNRARLRELFSGTAPIVITANGILQRTGDNNYPFDQDRSFWYLTGIDLPDTTLIMDKGKEYLFVPKQSRVAEAFNEVTSIEHITRISGITSVLDEAAGWKLLKNRFKRVKHVATLAPASPYLDVYGMYVNPARAALVAKLKDINPELELLDLREHIARLRMVKQPLELEAIQAAIDITVASLKFVMRPTQLRKYKYEYQLEADITRGFRARGATSSFDPIVAAGHNATRVHYQENNGAIGKNELIVMDVGAEVQHYAADISRTVIIGKPSSRQKKVYAAMVEAQDYALSQLKPGLIIKEFEDLMEQFMGEKFRELGLIKTISKETVRPLYPHMTCHFLGLDVHDAGDYYKPIEAGTVLACEPGVYIAKEGISVRLEDNILITPKGYKLLSHLPRTL